VAEDGEGVGNLGDGLDFLAILIGYRKRRGVEGGPDAGCECNYHQAEEDPS
jgi:hypothetical protein